MDIKNIFYLKKQMNITYETYKNNIICVKYIGFFIKNMSKCGRNCHKNISFHFLIL